ncbi:hypothetical protein EON63_20375, partial [archaeon]
KESLPTPPPQRGGGRGGRGGPREPPREPPKKIIVDVLEKLSFDVTGLLNKITPQTFDKLAQQLMDLPLKNTNELDRLTTLIFEKAVQVRSYIYTYTFTCTLINTYTHIYRTSYTYSYTCSFTCKHTSTHRSDSHICILYPIT